MRAKLKIASIKKTEGPQEILRFHGVSKADGYPADGSDENNTFAKWSPSVSLEMTVANPALHGKFKEGQELYVDFTFADPADAEAAAKVGVPAV